VISAVDVAGVAVTLLRTTCPEFVALLVEPLMGVTVNFGSTINPGPLLAMLEGTQQSITQDRIGRKFVIRVDGSYCGVHVAVVYERPAPDVAFVGVLTTEQTRAIFTPLPLRLAAERVPS
jgi:hypothetical protein